MSARVTAGGRLHFGFLNLSLARDRLYGGVGIALDEPRVVVEASPAQSVEAAHPDAREYARTAVDLLDVPGATVEVVESLPRHEGLGSGTQLALAVLEAVAAAHGESADPRERAPALGRGGRSGVGVAAFERGGFLVDAGHPTERFTTTRPADGEWAVPPVMVRRPVPGTWRFVLARPDAPAGRHDDDEEASMRSVVERADPSVAEELADVLAGGVLPAVATGDARAFGSAVARVNRLNGTWYADEQGGVYRPPVGAVVDELSDDPAVYGAGQSSWGPTVFGVTDRDHAGAARTAAEEALAGAGVDGEVRVVAASNEGAAVERQ
ncbi:GHMP kinase [Halobacteriales archaeon QS_1_68_20]|nr:MAG: GHMP kinase [Halobacteriales archaeon QS_1_68_20]